MLQFLTIIRGQDTSFQLLGLSKTYPESKQFACFILHGRISQNHRMVGVGGDLCGSSSPTPLPKQGHLQQAAQDLVQAGLQYLQRRRLHNLPGQPVPVLRHPQREEALPHVQTNFLCFSLCPFPLVLSLNITEPHCTARSLQLSHLPIHILVC